MHAPDEVVVGGDLDLVLIALIILKDGGLVCK